MYPGDFNRLSSGVLGFGPCRFQPELRRRRDMTPGYADGGYTYWTDFLFQGHVRRYGRHDRLGRRGGANQAQAPSWCSRSSSSRFVYTIAGSMEVGRWLPRRRMGFYDFAGSTLVHSVGGWGALIGILVPRTSPRQVLARMARSHDADPGQQRCPLATIGVFLLWLGWFGFNGGSVLSADPELTSLVLVTTCLAAAAGGIGAMVAYYLRVSSKPDLSMALNGILAGLVGITAGADVINPSGFAILVGLPSPVRSGRLDRCSSFDKIKNRRPRRRDLRSPHVRHLGHPGRRPVLQRTPSIRPW